MTHLTQIERYQIEHDLRLGIPIKLIAKGLGRSASAVGNEIRRNSGKEHYNHLQAQDRRDERARISAGNHPTIAPRVYRDVVRLIKTKYSPDQAIHALNLAISVSAVYRYLWRTKKTKVLRHLRHYHRHDNPAQMKWVKQAQSIHKRPKSILTRDCIGHMEVDSIVGKRDESTKIIVTVDRATRYVRLGLAKNGKVEEVTEQMRRWQQDPHLPILTITTDQGYEFAGLPALFPDNLYACDPGKPYQKGAVENMNGLIRQYIPKGQSLHLVTRGQLNQIEKALNNRPRKRLGYKSPAQLLAEINAMQEQIT